MQKILILVVMLVSISFGAERKIDVLRAGNFSVKVPEPKGLREVSGIKILNPLLESIGSTQNIPMGAYFQETFIKSFPHNEEPANKWATVLLPKTFEHKVISKARYLEFVAYLKKNNIIKHVDKKMIQTEVDHFNETFNENYGIDTNLTLKSVKAIPGLEYEKANYYGSMFLLRIDANRTVVATTAAMFANNKIFSINVYRQYHTYDDIEILMADSMEWFDSIIAANEFKKKK